MNNKDRECYIRSLEGFTRILDSHYQPSDDVSCALADVEAAEGVFRVILGSVAHDLEATRRENVFLRKLLEQK